MELLEEIIQGAFAFDSFWSIALRGAIWLIIALAIIANVDSASGEFNSQKLKSNLGFFLIFLVLSGGLIYLLFGVSNS